jgi:hypothetical protein
MTLRALFFSVLITSLSVAQTVSTDDALRRAVREAKPGDTIKIAPGTYQGGVFGSPKGTKDRRITIEAADPKGPPLIRGGTNCVHLAGAAYVTVRNLKLAGASGNGLNVDDGGTETPARGVVIEGLHVEDIGPKGNCDGIKLSGLVEFAVRDCTVTGWGGNAIDLVGCSEGVIEKCIIRGKDGFAPSTGPQMKGGSSKVTVRHCLFDNAAGRAINAGGSTGMQYFRPKDASYEAKDITIEHNLFLGGESPVAFVGIDGGIFRNNSIINPGKWVMRILQETKGDRFAPSRNVTFEKNLIVYTRAVRTTVNIGPDTAPETFKFADNWWYCSDAPTQRPQLPAEEKNGIYGKDPKVEKDASGWMVPTLEEAKKYGASPLAASQAR